MGGKIWKHCDTNTALNNITPPKHNPEASKTQNLRILKDLIT